MLLTCSVSLRLPVGVTLSTPVRADETRQYAKGDLLGKGGVMCFEICRMYPENIMHQFLSFDKHIK